MRRGLHLAELRLIAERGSREEPSAAADELAAMARETGTLPLIAAAFASSSQLQVTQGRFDDARALLVELDELRDDRSDPLYAALLPQFLRVARALQDAALAARLAEHIESRTALSHHALETARAQLAEVSGKHAVAAPLYAEAAARWHEFGNLPERAHALLGQGRCLTALGQPAEAPLTRARHLFASMGYMPALAETEALLAQDETAAL